MGDFFNNTAGGAIGIATKRFSTNGRRGQNFRNFQVPPLQTALYSLQIRQPYPDNSLVYSYVFPISPSSVRKEFNALANYYDVQGDTTNNGVQRIIDIYGDTPVTYVIEGTTGWQLHQTDGYQYTGLQSISQLENMLSVFATKNQQQIKNGIKDMYQLWFLDFFRNEYWSVIPIGPQGVRQSSGSPLYVHYAFRLVGIRNLTTSEPQLADSLATLLQSSDAQNSQTLQNSINNMYSLYAGSTIAAS